MEISDSVLVAYVEEVCQVLNLQDWVVKKTPFEIKPQGFFGIIVPLFLCGKTEAGVIRLNIIMKIAPDNSSQVNQFFNKEGYVYNLVLRNFELIQEELPLSTRLVFPQFYYSNRGKGRGIVVIENMSARGYKICPDDYLDGEHAKVVLKSLAKFHALSYLLEERHNATFKTSCNKITSNYFGNISGYHNFDEVREEFEGTRYDGVLQRLLDNFVAFCAESQGIPKVNVICHGDIWNNNILFKYEDNKPVDACLIDFQTVRIRSPAYDIIYFLITSVDPVLRQYFKKSFLDIYFDAFEKYLKEANYARGIISKEDLITDLKTVSPTCVMAASSVLWVTNNLQRDRKDTLTKADRDMNLHRYKTSMINIIDDLTAMGYL